MSAGPAPATSQGRSRRLVSSVTFTKERDSAEVLAASQSSEQLENGHGLENSSGAFTNSTASTISMPPVDSCILGKEILEQRGRFTLYKIEVNNGSKTWIIYKRYGDFVLLNKKLRKLYPQLRLHLPGKRFFKDNFNEDFIAKRRSGLEVFTNNLFCHRDLFLSDPVQKFYRLKNPPQPSESLEACQSYCQSLERSLADVRQQFRECMNSVNAELNAVKIELAQHKYYRDENQHLTNHLQKQQTDVEEATKSLRDQLTVALENGKQVKKELEKLKEEIRAERASVQAARVIEKQKREVGINRQVDMFNQSQEAVNQRVDSLITIMGQHSKVEVVIDGVKHEVNSLEGISNKAVQLRKALDESRSQFEKIHRNTVEMYKQEVEDFKAELSTADFLAKMRTQETESLKRQMSDLQKRYQDGIKAQDDYISQLNEIQQYAASTEEKYFFSLVIGVKVNMGVCGHRVDHINHLKRQRLFERVRKRGISIEHWPSWLSRELSTASASPDHEEDD